MVGHRCWRRASELTTAPTERFDLQLIDAPLSPALKLVPGAPFGRRMRGAPVSHLDQSLRAGRRLQELANCLEVPAGSARSSRSQSLPSRHRIRPRRNAGRLRAASDSVPSWPRCASASKVTTGPLTRTRKKYEERIRNKGPRLVTLGHVKRQIELCGVSVSNRFKTRPNVISGSTRRYVQGE